MIQYLKKPFASPVAPGIRFNDGACDRLGRFVAGTIISEDKSVPGGLFSFDPRDGSCVELDTGFTVGCH